MAGRMEFEFGFSNRSTRSKEPEQPFGLLVLADLSGGSERQPLAERKPLPIDVDSLDSRFAALFPSVRLSDEIVISFDSPDDLHPDALFQNLEIFRSLRQLRTRLVDPATFEEAAAELRGSIGGSAGLPEPGSDPGPAPAPAQPADDFQRLLGAAPAEPTRPRNHAVEDLIRKIVAPHIERAPDPSQALFLAAADQAIGETMRAILRHPAFRRLESAWLGLSRLVRNIESSEELRLFVFDVSRGELEDALAEGDPRASALHHALVASREVPGSAPWSLWVADFGFGSRPTELRTVAALGALAAESGACVIADAAPALVGIDSFSATADPGSWPGPAEEIGQAWKALRESAVAPWIGLVAPRVLLRLPYGADTDPTERIRFEEMPDPRAESYVWGSSALAVAQLTAQAFAEDGWGFSAPDGADIGDLPVHVYLQNGEKTMRATAEAFLPERAAETLLRNGIMPVLSIRGRDAARLVRVQSVASPVAALRGPWS